MIIEKVKSRKYKSTQYYKYRIIIPEDKIKDSGFKEGDELEANTTKGKIELKKK